MNGITRFFRDLLAPESLEETRRKESHLRLVAPPRRTYADAFAEQFDGGRGKLRTNLPPVA